MRIKKVKHSEKESKILIEYEKQSKNENWDEFSMHCNDQARPEFYLALKKLIPHLLKICELPVSYMDNINISSVSFSYGGENDTMGATITGVKKLKDSHAPLVLNTPHKPEAAYSGEGGDESNLLSEDCVRALNELQREAVLYVQDERAQKNLFTAPSLRSGKTSKSGSSEPEATNSQPAAYGQHVFP
jgi:hypothetical protein